MRLKKLSLLKILFFFAFSDKHKKKNDLFELSTQVHTSGCRFLKYDKTDRSFFRIHFHR
jgi:hypothetical protein